MLGYFFGAITAFVAVVALAIGLFNIPATVNGTRHYPRPVIARTVMVETQRHSPSVAKGSSPVKSVAKEASSKSVAKEASSAKDVSPVVATAKADTKKSKHYKPKVFARQRDNYGHWNARGYAQGSGYGPRGFFFQ